MYDFLVKGSRGDELFQAVSQEWALSLYKVKHGEHSLVFSCEWVR